MNELLEVSDLQHSYGNLNVLSGVSFSLRAGESMALLGRNGSGKSTVLQLLAGLLRMQSGSLTYKGTKGNGQNKLLRSETGVVFQTTSLDAKLSIEQNLILSGHLFGISNKDSLKRASHLMRLAGLEDRMNSPVAKLSGGMRRKVDVARALMNSPKLILMDEPTTGFDAVSFEQTWGFLDSVRRQLGVAILVATHRGEEAERCSSIAILKEGKIALQGTPALLKKKLGSDIVVLEGSNAVGIAETINQRFSLPALVEKETVVVDCEHGHTLVPRIVESFPPGTIRTISLREASISDVFLKVCAGAAFSPAQEGAAR